MVPHAFKWMSMAFDFLCSLLLHAVALGVFLALPTYQGGSGSPAFEGYFVSLVDEGADGGGDHAKAEETRDRFVETALRTEVPAGKARVESPARKKENVPSDAWEISALTPAPDERPEMSLPLENDMTEGGPFAKSENAREEHAAQGGEGDVSGAAAETGQPETDKEGQVSSAMEEAVEEEENGAVSAGGEEDPGSGEKAFARAGEDPAREEEGLTDEGDPASEKNPVLEKEPANEDSPADGEEMPDEEAAVALNRASEGGSVASVGQPVEAGVEKAPADTAREKKAETLTQASLEPVPVNDTALDEQQENASLKSETPVEEPGGAAQETEAAKYIEEPATSPEDKPFVKAQAVSAEEEPVAARAETLGTADQEEGAALSGGEEVPGMPEEDVLMADAEAAVQTGTEAEESKAETLTQASLEPVPVNDTALDEQQENASLKSETPVEEPGDTAQETEAAKYIEEPATSPEDKPFVKAQAASAEEEPVAARAETLGTADHEEAAALSVGEQAPGMPEDEAVMPGADAGPVVSNKEPGTASIAMTPEEKAGEPVPAVQHGTETPDVEDALLNEQQENVSLETESRREAGGTAAVSEIGIAGDEAAESVSSTTPEEIGPVRGEGDSHGKQVEVSAESDGDEVLSAGRFGEIPAGHELLSSEMSRKEDAPEDAKAEGVEEASEAAMSGEPENPLAAGAVTETESKEDHGDMSLPTADLADSEEVSIAPREHYGEPEEEAQESSKGQKEASVHGEEETGELREKEAPAPDAIVRADAEAYAGIVNAPEAPDIIARAVLETHGMPPVEDASREAREDSAEESATPSRQKPPEEEKDGAASAGPMAGAGMATDSGGMAGQSEEPQGTVKGESPDSVPSPARLGDVRTANSPAVDGGGEPAGLSDEIPASGPSGIPLSPKEVCDASDAVSHSALHMGHVPVALEGVPSMDEKEIHELGGAHYPREEMAFPDMPEPALPLPEGPEKGGIPEKGVGFELSTDSNRDDVVAVIATPENNRVPSGEDYFPGLEREQWHVPAKGSPEPEESVTEEKDGIILSLSEDVRIEVYFEGEETGVSCNFLRKAHPMDRKGAHRHKELDITPNVEETGAIQDKGRKKVFTMVKAEKGVYTFLVRNGGSAARDIGVMFRFHGNSRAERVEEFTENVVREGIVKFIFIMPEAVFWDDENYFTGTIEGPDTLTRFSDETGLVWKEKKEFVHRRRIPVVLEEAGPKKDSPSGAPSYDAFEASSGL